MVVNFLTAHDHDNETNNLCMVPCCAKVNLKTRDPWSKTVQQAGSGQSARPVKPSSTRQDSGQLTSTIDHSQTCLKLTSKERPKRVLPRSEWVPIRISSGSCWGCYSPIPTVNLIDRKTIRNIHHQLSTRILFFYYENMSNCSQNCWINWNSATILLYIGNLVWIQ